MSLLIFNLLDYNVQNLGKHHVGGRGDTCAFSAYLCQCNVFNMAGIFHGIFTINFDLAVTFSYYPNVFRFNYKYSMEFFINTPLQVVTDNKTVVTPSMLCTFVLSYESMPQIETCGLVATTALVFSLFNIYVIGDCIFRCLTGYYLPSFTRC